MYVNLYLVLSLMPSHNRNLKPQSFVGNQWVKDYGEYLAASKYNHLPWKDLDPNQPKRYQQIRTFPEIAAMYLEWLSGVNGWELQSRVNHLIYPTETLYLLQCGDHQKIGISRKFESRLSSIQNANPFPVDVIKKVQCVDAKSHESKLLIKYHSCRVSGEWFKLSFRQIREIVSYMDSIQDATPAKLTSSKRQSTPVQLSLLA